MKLLMENWRTFVKEQEEQAEKFFVILLGGSGTGKGALVGTNAAIGELQKLMGQGIGRAVKVGSADAIKTGEAGARVVFEPDRVLRLHQRAQAQQDFERLKAGESPEKVFADIPEAEAALKDGLLKLTANNGIQNFKTIDDYVGRIEQVGGAKTPKQAIAMSDALDGDYGGNSQVQYIYKQMRERPFKGSGAGIKDTAVAMAQEEMKGVVGQAKAAAETSFILDSAGEDLASQPVASELEIAKAAGFTTAIVLLATGTIQSFLGNMERSVARGGRNVAATEIMKFYNVLFEKHKEFVAMTRTDPPLLDEYVVLEQDAMSPKEIEDLVQAICNPGDLLGLDIPDVAGNEIASCIPSLANPEYLPDEEKAAALAGAATVDAGDSPDNQITNWDQAFAAAKKQGVIDDPIKAKKDAFYTVKTGLYARMQDARTTGEAEILRPINAKTDMKTATAVIAKALRMAAQSAKGPVAESKTFRKPKIKASQLMKISKTKLKEIIKEELGEIPDDPEMEEKDPDPTGVFRELYEGWTPQDRGQQAYKDDLGRALGFLTYDTDDPSGYSGGTRTTIDPSKRMTFPK